MPQLTRFPRRMISASFSISLRCRVPLHVNILILLAWTRPARGFATSPAFSAPAFPARLQNERPLRAFHPQSSDNWSFLSSSTPRFAPKLTNEWRGRKIEGLGEEKLRDFCHRRRFHLSMCTSSEDDRRAQALVTPQWLQENLEKVTVLDVRGVVDKKDLGDGETETAYVSLRADYDKGHIPGAAFIDWTKDIVDTEDPVPVQLAGADAFAAAMEERGVGNGKTVVVYDGGKMLFATRLWWALTLYGHPDVRVLDGGWARWVAEGRDTDWDEGCPLKMYSSFDPEENTPSLRSDANDVQNLLQSRSQSPETAPQIIDARSKAQWQGKERRGPRAGRIPGALSVPYKTLLDPSTGGYLPRDQMLQVLAQSGVEFGADKPFLCYCNGGVASTAVLFALWQLGAPLENLSNYDGSWGEWGRGDYPMETDMAE